MKTNDQVEIVRATVQTEATSRRKFLRITAAAAAFSVVPRSIVGGPGPVAPSNKTTLACIGVGGQGIQNLAALL